MVCCVAPPTAMLSAANYRLLEFLLRMNFSHPSYATPPWLAGNIMQEFTKRSWQGKCRAHFPWPNSTPTCRSPGRSSRNSSAWRKKKNSGTDLHNSFPRRSLFCHLQSCLYIDNLLHFDKHFIRITFFWGGISDFNGIPAG